MEKYKYNVRFRLEQRRDKSGNVIESNCPINADITFSGKRIFYFTGYRIDADKWTDKVIDGVRVQQVKRNNFNQDGTSATEINARLQEVRAAVGNVFRRLEVNDTPATPTIVRAELKKELDEEPVARRTLCEYYTDFVNEESVAQTWTPGTTTKHNTIIKHLQDYKRQIYFEDITDDWLNGFVRCLIVEKKLSNPYVAKLLKNFKWFMNWATKKGHNKILTYKDFAPKLKGVSTSDKTNIIALSMDEYLQLYNLDVKQPYLQRVRDVFCFCAATSLRYSDVKNLKWANVKGNRIELVTIKTDDPIVIYLNKFSQGIIDKYAENRGFTEHVLPVVSNQKYNDYLKELCKLAGFDAPQTKVTYKGAERIETTLPKYELITSHVARKTFVTIALYLGIPADVVRSFTGHKDAKVMERYLKFNPGQKEQWMQKFDFQDTTKENVFDFDITPEERKKFGVPADKSAYLRIISNEPDLNVLHLAFLFNHRGDVVKALEYVGKLPDAMKVEFMKSIAK